MVLQSSKTKSALPLIIGVGASAGGLKPVQDFLRGIQPGEGLCIVLVFHRDPAIKSHLPELLKKCTEFEVLEVEEGLVLAPDHLYLAPGHALLSIENNVLRVKQRGTIAKEPG